MRTYYSFNDFVLLVETNENYLELVLVNEKECFYL